MSNQIIAEASIDVNEAPRQAENAQKTANDAKDLAGTADNNIKNINDPNYLSPFEKPQLQVQMDNFATIYSADKNIATAEGIDFTSYDAAYQAYLAYMTPLIADMTTYSPIVRATFNSMVTAVQVEQKRFNAATQAQYNQQIKQAQTDIDDGQTKYKALQSDAETMKSSVAGIADAADRAISSAGFASNVASTASQAATTASQAASSALTSAMSAESDASSAVSIANSTASAFGPVKQSADSALSTASSAVAIANSTASGFGKVGQKADSALSNAMSAESAASSAVTQASSAAADSKDAQQIAGAVSQSYKTLTDGSTMTIAELEGGLAVKLTKADLNGYATQDWAQNQIKLTADGISGSLSSVKSTVDGQTTSINDLQADSSGFKTQFTTVNDTLGKHTTDIGNLQVSSKELTSGFNTLTTDNGTNKNDISQLKQTATELSSTLETVQTQVTDSSVGTNLYTDTRDFDNPSAWTNWLYSYKTEEKFNGLTVMGTKGDWTGLGQIIQAKKGETYTFSIYARYQSGTGKSPIYFRVPDGSTNTDIGAVWASLNETWQRVIGTVTITDDGPINVRMERSNDNTNTLLIAGLKLERGSKATDYSVSPLDNATVTAVSSILQTVDGMQTDISKKIEQKDLNGYATETWTNGQIKTTADGINGTLSKKIEKTDLNGYATEDWAQNKIDVSANGINANMSSIKNTVDGQTTSINDLKADSSSFKTQFTTVTDTLGKHTTDIGSLQASSKELSSNFSSLNTDNSTNKTNISKLSQTVEGIQTDISKKIEQKDLNGYATETWTQGQIKLTADDISGVLSKKIEKTDLNGYATEDWTQNKIKITADGINGTISSVKGTVDSQTTSINTLQADSNGFKDQFTKVNNTISQHTTDIGTLQSDAKSLSSNFDSLNTDNGTNQHNISDLQQTAKKFSSTISKVDNLTSKSPSNIINDGSFNSAVVGKIPSGWDFSGTAQIAVNSDKTSDLVALGHPVIQINSQISGNSDIYYGDWFDVQPGDQFYAEFKARWSSMSQKGQILLGVVTKDATGKWTWNRAVTIGSPSNWAKYTGVLTIPAGAVQGRVWAAWQSSAAANEAVQVTDLVVRPAYATTTELTQVKQTADGAQALASNNQGNIAKLQVTAKGLQSTVSDKVSSDQLTQLSNQLTNKISDLSSSTSSQFTQTAGDINGLVKKGDVVNQFNLDAGGALLSTSGNSTKIVFSSPNIIFDSANPVQIPNANIPGTLTGKTIEAGTITATTKIRGADIEAPIIHSPSGLFKLDGNTGDIVGASIHSSDGSWGITANGKISGASVTSSMIDISGDGSGPNFDAENVTPDTATGIYSRYKYTNPNVGFDANGMGRKMYKNGYLVINGDTFLNRTIGDWSADGGGKYVYDTMYEANVIKMRAYNYTGSNVQTDDPSKTQGTISSRLDIQPSAITMGPDWSVGNPNILIDNTGRIKVGTIATNGGHSIGTTDGRDLYFMKMNKDATNVGGSSISIHVKKLYQSSLLSLKTDIKPIDPNTALETINNTDFMSYHFKNDKSNEPISVSPILDDVNPIPKYNTPDIFKSANGDSRNDGNILGYTALAVKALYAKVQDLNSRLQKLEGAN